MAKKAARKTSKATSKKAPRRRAAEAVEPLPAPADRGPALVGLSDVLGQSRAIAVLDSALSSGRLHHAWIFHGPEGVGKFTAALAFAAVLLDPAASPDLAGAVRADPTSRVHRLVAAGSHPDLHVVRKELAASSRDDRVRASKQTTLAKEVVLEFLIEPAERTRVMPGDSIASKVFIVDEAHLLGVEAQNALLKTIEEPAEGTVVVLITPSEDRLLPTIRSRCQRVAFGPLDDGSMRAWVDRSGLDLAGADPDWAMRFAGGSPGTLEAIVRTGLGRWQEAVAPAIERLGSGRGVIELGAALAKLVDEAAVEAVAGDPRASKDVANRVAARRMFRLLGESFRGEVRAALARGDAPRAEWASACIGLVDEAEGQLNSNVSVAMVFEQLSAGCVAGA